MHSKGSSLWTAWLPTSFFTAFLSAALSTGVFVKTQPIYGAELSLLKGLFKQTQPDDGFDTTTIEAGGRYSQQFSRQSYWFGQGVMTLRSYSGGTLTPSNSSSLNIAGGVRRYFQRLSPLLAPFAAVTVGMENDVSAVVVDSGLEETSIFGVHYGAEVGLRLNASRAAFIDLSVPLFTSYLAKNTKVTTKTLNSVTGAINEAKTETNDTELYGTSEGYLTTMVVAIGIRI